MAGTWDDTCGLSRVLFCDAGKDRMAMQAKARPSNPVFL